MQRKETEQVDEAVPDGFSHITTSKYSVIRKILLYMNRPPTHFRGFIDHRCREQDDCAKRTNL